MRVGVVLPRDGPLSERAAIEATGRAAEELEYACVWAASADQLSVVTSVTDQVSVALLVTGHRAGEAGLARASAASAGLGRRLAGIAVPEPDLGLFRELLPRSFLLSSSPTAPISPAIRGWAPQVSHPTQLDRDWRIVDPDRVLTVRICGRPSRSMIGSLLTAAVDQLVVALPAAVTLDDQLAAFAEIAERLSAPSA